MKNYAIKWLRKVNKEAAVAFGVGGYQNRGIPTTQFHRIDSRLFIPFDLQGERWHEEGERPIAVFWGFNAWKRPFTLPFFPDHKLAFVRGRRAFWLTKRFFRYLPPCKEMVFVSWGVKIPAAAKKYAERHNIKVLFVEDGFLRSFNPGALHVQPYSLAIDSKAPYYNWKGKPDVSDMLAAKRAEPISSEMRVAAEAGISIMRAAKLTKYYPLSIQEQARIFSPPDNKKIVLLIGQVEDDASIIYGHAKHYSNWELFERASKDFPDAYLVYRPHPDVYFNARKSRDEKKLQETCTISDPSIDLLELLGQVDHVYTATSLVGLEAVINGVPATVIGRPFYSTSGLEGLTSLDTRDAQALDLHNVFVTAYLEYPVYIHPISLEKTTFFELASYFIVEKYKHSVFKGAEVSSLDFEALWNVKGFLSPAATLLVYFLRLGRDISDDKETISALLGDDIRLADFPQVSSVLLERCHFDALAVYVEKAAAVIHKDIEYFKRNTHLMEKVFIALGQALRALRGRAKITVPDLVDWFLADERNATIPGSLFVSYVNCLQTNLQYDPVKAVIERLRSPTVKADISSVPPRLLKMLDVLTKRPARSERRAFERSDMVNVLGSMYEAALATERSGPIHSIINRIITASAKGHLADSASAMDDLLSFAKNSEEQLRKAINERPADIMDMATYFMRHSRDDVVKALFDLMDDDAKWAEKKAVLKLRNLIEVGNYQQFALDYMSIDAKLKLNNRIRDLHVRYMLETGNLPAAKKLVQEIIASSKTTQAKRALSNDQLEKIEFSIEASRIVNSVAQPAFPRGVVFIGCHTDYKTLAMLAPALREVKRMGYAVISLTNGLIAQQATGLPSVDALMGSMPTTTRVRKDQYHNEWEIDWKKKLVRSGEVNYYQGFYEALANHFRRYTIDLNDEATRNNFYYRLMRADDALHIAKRIVADVADRGLPSIIISSDSHIVPFSIFRDFCGQVQHPNLSYVNVNIGYENYFSNLGGKYSTTMTVTDMTLHPNHRAPFLARADRFEMWYDNNKRDEAYNHRANELITANRVHATSDDAALGLVDFLSKQRKNGKTIICCFGKIPIDLGVPYDGGPAHADLKDWLNHTIETVNGSEEIILLIKPHPHELRPEIALDLVDYFTDLIDVNLSENVRILDHREINNYQLAEHIQLALMWNGSSSLELTALGVPVVMGSYFGRHDYPVNLLYPKSRSGYSELILSRDYGTISLETRRRAAYLISYMESRDVSIRNDYSYRPVTNDIVGVPAWRTERVEQLLREGDPEMIRAAQRIVERFEKR